jgi:hypothetical protein
MWEHTTTANRNIATLHMQSCKADRKIEDIGSLNWYLSNIFNKETSFGYFFLQLQSIAFLA